MEENEIGKTAVDAVVKVHSAPGPGLLESVYEAVLAREFERRGLSVARQVAVPIEYEGMKFDEGFRVDIIVEGKVIIVPKSMATTRPDAKQTGPLKSVEQMSKAHHKQLFTYLKLNELKLGYLLNFGAVLIKDGIKRMINGLDDEKLGVFGSLRESRKKGQPGGDLNSESLRSSP